jgi:hypothetical protein
MALAILEFVEAGRSGPRFRIDIGKNAYYSYAIGGKETTRQNGLELLLDPVFTSPVAGPLPPSAMGRAFFDVPDGKFDREHRRIQLASFRTKDRMGPAISEIVNASIGSGAGFDDLPAPAFISRARGFESDSGANMTTTGFVETVPYSYQRGEAYSSAMFLNILTSILPKVLPAVGSLLGGLVKPGGGNGAPTGGPADLLAKLGNPETIKLLTDLIKQVSTAKAVGTTVVYRDAESHQAAAFALSRYKHQFSEAQVAPALLAALPALMPVIEKVLNPETMKAIMENVSPAKLVGTVTESIGNFAKLGMEDTKQLTEHLERLNPGVKNPELYKLLEGLSTGEARAGSKLKYKRVDSVKLSLTGTTPQTLYGRSRLAYKYGQDLSFPLDVQTPKPIRHATLEACLKEAATLRIVHEKRYQLDEISSGPLDTTPAIPWHAISKLKSGEDYLLTLALCWNGKKGTPKRGTAVSQLITLVSEYAFDRVEESSPDLVPLDDATRDREFWHRIWDETFQDRGLTRVRFACEYAYVLDGNRTANARMQTKGKSQPDEETRRREGHLKSGMILSPDALSKLVPRVSGGKDQPLSDAQLTALRTPDFVDRFNQAAKSQVEFKGRRGESVALWVYPEMKLRDVVLKKIGSVNEHGHVQSFEEETVRFPMPAMVHFVGTGSPDRSLATGTAEGSELDGLRVIFDQKVGLYPANLQKAAEPAAGRAPAKVPARPLPRGPAYVH